MQRPSRPRVPRKLRGLYPILDVDALGGRAERVLALAEAVLAARPAILQLRAKSLPVREVLELLRALQLRCQAVGTALYANDRPDLAWLAGCDGVHLGQEDVPPRLVREHFPSLALGWSTHNLAQLQESLALPLSYVALGPVFETCSKLNPDPSVGLSMLVTARQLLDAHAPGRLPLVAIGGIRRETIAEVAKHAELAAVIGELVVPPDQAARRAQELQRAWSA